MAKKTTLPPDIPADENEEKTYGIHLDHAAGLAVLYEKFSKLYSKKTGIEEAVSYTAEGYCWTNNYSAICVYDKNVEPFKVGKAFVKYTIESPHFRDVFKDMKTYHPAKEVTTVLFRDGDLELNSLNPISFFKKQRYVQIGKEYYSEQNISAFLLFAQKTGKGLVNVDFFVTENEHPLLYGIMTDTDSKRKLADFLSTFYYRP